MATVPQSKAALDALYATNGVGDISGVDLQQLTATVLPAHTSVTTATHDVTDADLRILVNYPGAVTITVKSDQFWDGREFVIVDVSGAASANHITLVTEGSETLNGESELVIDIDRASLTLYSDGTNAVII